MQINSFPGFFLVLHPFLALVTLFVLQIPNLSNSTLAHQPSLGLILVLRPSSLSIIRDSSFSSHSHSHVPISCLIILNSKYPTHPLVNSHPPPRTGYPPSFQSLLILPTFLRPPLPLPLQYSTVPDSKAASGVTMMHARGSLLLVVPAFRSHRILFSVVSLKCLLRARWALCV